MSYRDAQGRSRQQGGSREQGSRQQGGSREQGSRRHQARRRQMHVRRERFVALGSLAAVVIILLVVVLSSIGSGSPSSSHHAAGPGGKASNSKSSNSKSTAARSPARATATVPILDYHVINVRPPTTSAPASLYTPADEFASQMEALKAAGWHAVTLNQLEANWTRGASLGPGKPIVISFDTGYASQYTNALPVLKRLGWVGVENLQIGGLSPSDGGLTDTQIRGLVAAGWELDTQGDSATDLTTLGASTVQQEITTARQTLRTTYGVPVNWFSYPSGDYDPTVAAAVRAAGFLGSTTVIAGWASATGNRFALPRLEVAADTTPTQLLSQITAAKSSSPPPAFYDSPAGT